MVKIVIRKKKDDNPPVLKHRFKNIVNNNKTKEDYNNMIKSIKNWILVGCASLLLVACGQGGGGAG